MNVYGQNRKILNQVKKMVSIRKKKIDPFILIWKNENSFILQIEWKPIGSLIENRHRWLLMSQINRKLK